MVPQRFGAGTAGLNWDPTWQVEACSNRRGVDAGLQRGRRLTCSNRCSAPLHRRVCSANTRPWVWSGRACSRRASGAGSTALGPERDTAWKAGETHTRVECDFSQGATKEPGWAGRNFLSQNGDPRNIFASRENPQTTRKTNQKEKPRHTNMHPAERTRVSTSAGEESAPVSRRARLVRRAEATRVPQCACRVCVSGSQSPLPT